MNKKKQTVNCNLINMKNWLPLFVSLFYLSCNNDQSKNKNSIGSDLNIAVVQPNTITKTDTVGCVLHDTKQDTLISIDNLHAHVNIETYCIDQTFWDTTISVGGEDLTTKYKNFALYNYREAKIKFEVANKVNEILINNQSFKDSISDNFYRKGMLNKPNKIKFVSKDTSLTFEIDLFVPGDDRLIISTNVNRKGKINVLSTRYEGAY